MTEKLQIFHFQFPKYFSKKKMIFAACTQGYFGKFCNKSCPLGKFGDRCGGKCFPRCTDEYCDPVNGCLLPVIIEKPKHTTFPSKRYKSLNTVKKKICYKKYILNCLRVPLSGIPIVISKSVRDHFSEAYFLSPRLNLGHTSPTE